jgi:hypothetical protein
VGQSIDRSICGERNGREGGRERRTDGRWCRTGAMGGGGRIRSSSGCRPPSTRGAPSPNPRLRRWSWLRLDLGPSAQHGPLLASSPSHVGRTSRREVPGCRHGWI